MKNKEWGFTLIELLVVIVILGILSTISVGTFRSYFAKARDAERLSAVRSITKIIMADSAQKGDCGAYNYTIDAEGHGGTKVFQGSDKDCQTEDIFELLLLNNDFSMPKEKNGLLYFYGFRLGTTEGKNDFFILSPAEGDEPQGAQQVGTDENDPYVFVDGTAGGIAAATYGVYADGTCDLSADLPSCGEGWVPYYITETGKLFGIPTSRPE